MSVKPGQVYEDADPRDPGRRLRVVATFRKQIWRGDVLDHATCIDLGTGRTRVIRCDRMHGPEPRRSGFRLVEDVGEPA